MSQENVRVLLQGNARFNEGDYVGALADFHPDVVWHNLMHAPDAPKTVRGVAAVRGLWESFDESFDEFSANIEECIQAGDSVVCDTRWHFKGKGSQVAFDLRTAEGYTFDRGRIVRATLGYADKAEALKAVGPAE